MLPDESTDNLEAEFDAAASEFDAKTDEAAAAVAPEGDFSGAALGRLSEALGAAMALFGPEAPPPPAVEGDADILPAELVQALTMVATAATDADLGEVLSLADLEVADDRDLSLLTGKLRSLAGSRDFKQFLKQAGPDAAPVEAPPAPAPAEGGGEDADALFMQRV